MKNITDPQEILAKMLRDHINNKPKEQAKDDLIESLQLEIVKLKKQLKKAQNA